MRYLYKIFGYNIESDFQIVQATEVEEDGYQPDIRIIKAELTGADVDTEYDHFSERSATFSIDDIGLFRITGGQLIEVKPLCQDLSRLSIFLTGSCMGAVLHQRKEFVLHGSVITNGFKTLLFTGESGAGKSTLAARFCANGWKLLTDDVALVKNPETDMLVQPSYPSQKLWADSLLQFYDDETKIHSLYQRKKQLKYGVNATDFFLDRLMPLTDVFLICPGGEEVQVSSVEGLEKIKLLMDNTYRSYMILRKDQQRHFQQCVTMSTKLHMATVNRPADCDSQIVFQAIEKLL